VTHRVRVERIDGMTLATLRTSDTHRHALRVGRTSETFVDQRLVDGFWMDAGQRYISVVGVAAETLWSRRDELDVRPLARLPAALRPIYARLAQAVAR